MAKHFSNILTILCSLKVIQAVENQMGNVVKFVHSLVGLMMMCRLQSNGPKLENQALGSRSLGQDHCVALRRLPVIAI